MKLFDASVSLHNSEIMADREGHRNHFAVLKLAGNTMIVL